jgi:hypothetical protein
MHLLKNYLQGFENIKGGEGYRQERTEFSGSLAATFGARLLFAIFALRELLLILCVSQR